MTEKEQVEHNFTYHPPNPENNEKYSDIRTRARLLALFIVETCPSTRERALALTNLENCVFWANASIARNS
jgi:hypothetical protein